MPNLSANTLFHFTSRRWILDKLEYGFKPRYSPEFSPETDGDFFNGIGRMYDSKRTGKDATGKDTYESTPVVLEPIRRYIPMVCFCDIPMTRLEKHMAIYNTYGIGLTKAWGINKGINPIMYLNEESTYFQSVGNQIMTLSFLYNMLQGPFKKLAEKPEFKSNPTFGTITQAVSNQWGLFSELQMFLKTYFKPYQSKGPYRGQPAPYRYYDEKEWRYGLATFDWRRILGTFGNKPESTHEEKTCV